MRHIINKISAYICALALLLMPFNYSIAADIDGTIESVQKISDLDGGFEGILDNSDAFGGSVTSLGDLDGDGITDIAVGTSLDDDGGTNRGAVYILFLNNDGTVKGEQKISDTEGGFTGALDDSDGFGVSVENIGDVDGDGITDIAVGATGDDDGGTNRGAVWILFLNNNGTVKGEQKISDTSGGFLSVLDNLDSFGNVVAGIGDLDGDNIPDIAIGATGDDDGGGGRGAVYIVFLNANGTVKDEQKISSTTGGLTGPLENNDAFGSVAPLGDIDGDGVPDIAVGANRDDDGGTDRGAVYILFLNPDGTVKDEQKISDTQGGFTGTLDDNANFGRALAYIGEWNGRPVLGVTASGDNDGGVDSGAIYILFLNNNGTVHSHQKISNLEGGLGSIISSGDSFGSSLAFFELDGAPVLAAGATGDDTGGSNRGAVYILFMNQNLVLPTLFSENYRIDNDSFTSGGYDIGSSATYMLRGTVGGISAQGSESASYQENSGYRQGIYDQVASFELFFQNRATQVAATALANETVTVTSAVGFAQGDMVLIVQNEGANQISAMGSIVQIAGNDLVLDGLTTNGTTPTIDGADDYVYNLTGAGLNLGTLNPAIVSTAVVGWQVNAEHDNGYSVYVYDDGDFSNGVDIIPDVADGTVTAGASEFGARSSDTSLAESTFDTQDTAITENFQQIGSRETSEFASRDFLTVKAAASATQPGGAYSGTITVVYVGDY